jgi:hypothetical protein
LPSANVTLVFSATLTSLRLVLSSGSTRTVVSLRSLA